jgi:hypothetical protein
MAGTRYSGVTRDWAVPSSSRDELLRQIGARCLELDIQIVDIPKFVGSMLSCPVPFSRTKKALIDYSQDA